eukprot:scaffold19543_cov127-Skeletonema_marinoi.AAC.2
MVQVVATEELMRTSLNPMMGTMVATMKTASLKPLLPNQEMIKKEAGRQDHRTLYINVPRQAEHPYSPSS